ncbi:MAG: 4Fe-4S binding protein [Synergistaceae bacterium]|jgi:polyferredoxin|nr:4Fe-4S binding protein [Synergistaceae bacterium]
MIRRAVQWLTLLGCNAWWPGFIEGRIYGGKLKSVCVPGLNCYSCPGAVASCPLGSLQAVLGSWRYSFSFYVVGLMMAFGLLFGRFICGFLCPFGLLQELAHKLSSRLSFLRGKQAKQANQTKNLRWRPIYVKYILGVVFVVALPLLATNSMGLGDPAFCKYICPAGTLTAGAPLLAANPSLRDAVGWLFVLKAGIAVATLAGCLAIYRFFCKYLCPLGAFYGLFNKVAVYRLRLEEGNCVHCGACSRVCKMAVDPSRTPNSPECIRCGDCVRACRFSALSAGFSDWRRTSENGGSGVLRGKAP